MKILPVLIVGLACRAGAPAAPAVLPGPAFPHYASPQQLAHACERHLGAALRRLAALERHAPDGRWLAAYDDLNASVEDAAGPIFLLSNVHPDKAVREAAEKCELRWQDFFSSLGQNEALYRALKQVQARDAIDREMIKVTLEGFEDAGVALQGAARARAKQINDRLTELAQSFDRNIRDAGIKVAFTEAELKGVPPAVWKSAPRDSETRVLLGLDSPTYDPVLENAESEVARERMWRAKQSQGGQANLALLAEAVALRKEYAQLFDMGSYGDFTLRRRMVGTSARAQAFLAEVSAAVTEREKRELAELTQFKAKHLGIEVRDTRFNRWDVLFYYQRLRRERFAVDQEALRPYFPPQQSLQFALRVIERMMGVRYTRVPGVKLWHPDAQAFAVSDATTGKPLAALLVDLYPRDGKYNHAAVWPIRGSSTRLKRVSQAALVVNFNRQGLTLDELETLLHELGHSVHGNLSATRYSVQAGTAVLRDFVEAPSQMLEDWVYDRRVLDVFKEVCRSCTPVPDALLAQVKLANKRSGKGGPKGIGYARQQLYASYDLALYGTDAPDPLATWVKLEGATPLGHVAGTTFPANFAHIMSGYAAGYYGYLWSEVVAFDLRTAFARDRLDPRVGRRYRDTILANGGQRPPLELVREFLGRETNSKAFFDDLQD